MKTWIAIGSAAAGALALSAFVSAQTIQSTPVPGKTTPMAGGMAGQAPKGTGPSMKADCANNGWQNYPDQNFKTQKACESYVRKHAPKKGTRSMAQQTPGPGMTSPGSAQSKSAAPTPPPR